MLLTLTVGCSDPATNSANIVATQPTSAYVVDHGNGVYYLPMKDEDFAKGLSRFVGEHPDLEVVAIAGNGERYGDSGYFVITRPVRDCN